MVQLFHFYSDTWRPTGPSDLQHVASEGRNIYACTTSPVLFIFYLFHRIHPPPLIVVHLEYICRILSYNQIRSPVQKSVRVSLFYFTQLKFKILPFQVGEGMKAHISLIYLLEQFVFTPNNLNLQEVRGKR